VRWCRAGPRHATVYELRVGEVAPEGYGRFEIR
jgi:hypothetical protein